MDKHEHRRQRLLELRTWACDGMTVRLAERIARSDSYVARMLYEEGKAGKKRIGDDMLDVLEAAFGLDHGWFDLPLATPMTGPGQTQIPLAPPESSTPPPISLASRRQPMHWPFHAVTYQRLMDLKASLGPKHGAEALRDIDALLDVAVTKWERQGKTDVRRRS